MSAPISTKSEDKEEEITRWEAFGRERKGSRREMETAEAMTEVLMVGGGGGTERSETDRAIQRSHHRHFRHFSLSLWGKVTGLSFD